MTLVNTDNTISKVAQSVQAVGSLLQGPKSYILMVRNPGIKETVTRCTQGCRLPVCPAPSLCSEPSEGSRAWESKATLRPDAPDTGPAVP